MNLMQLDISKKTAYLGLFTVLALAFSYLETLIPLNFGIPGIKLGLSNTVILCLLFLFSFKEALIVNIARILLSGFLFGNMYGILYSLAGGIVSMLAMWLAKRCKLFSIYGISIAGGVFHNITQLVVAAFVINNLKISMYGPVLIISGFVTGLIVAYISKFILKSVETYVRL